MIPKTFQLGGRTWTVRRGVKCGKKKWYGKCYGSECRIDISDHNKDPEEELHTFMHELLHAIAQIMCWDEFNEDEGKIDAVASLLLQVMTTADEAPKP